MLLLVTTLAIIIVTSGCGYFLTLFAQWSAPDFCHSYDRRQKEYTNEGKGINESCHLTNQAVSCLVLTVFVSCLVIYGLSRPVRSALRC